MKTSVIDIGLQWERPALTLALSAAMNQSEAAQVIVNTTGSSGIRKRVLLSIGAIAKSAELSNAQVGAKPGDIWSLLLPTNHIAGLNVLARAIKLGSEVVSSTDAADYTAIVPTQLHRALFDDPKLLEHLQKCKSVLVGGSPASKTLLELAAKAGVNVITTYGMTETSGGCVYSNKPLPGISVMVDESGRLMIKGSILANGYENNQELWNEKFRDGWFLTSDLGVISDDTVEIIGRADDVVISGGENISLDAIEGELATNFPNINFLATAIADAEWGQKLCLISDMEIDEYTISQVLKSKLGKQFVPKEFLVVEQIPEIGIGKPDRVKASQLFIDKQR
ncbi:MAG: AMP-binding protein [Actinomycetes bacterium]